MKRYTNTTSSMKDQKLSVSRRHFVASATIAPLALGAAASLVPSSAQADVMKILEDDNVLGDTTAPIAIVEYASLTCGHCGNFHNNILHKIKKDFIDTGKAYLVYRDFPLDRWAFQASVLAHTAGKNRFFPALEILYSKQPQWRDGGNITEDLAEIGKMLGVPRAKFDAALEDQELGERILMDRMVGNNEYGVDSTPSIFINGERFNYYDHFTGDENREWIYEDVKGFLEKLL